MFDEAASRLTTLLEEGSGPTAARTAVLAACSGDRFWTTGFARAGEAPPAPTARFLTYSITKTMAAAAALRLAGRGEIDLDAPLDRWLPDFAPAARLTLADLLSHRAGLYNYGGMPTYHAAVRAGAEPWTEDEFLARCRAAEPFAPPGQQFSYSNIGYLLVKRLLERASGLSFAALLERELFGPLGLTDWSVPTTRADLAGLHLGPSPYLGGDGPPVAVAGLYHPGWVSHGVVAATALDTARLLHGLFTAGLLAPQLAARMVSSWPVPGQMRGRPWVEPGYGLGLMVERDPQAGPCWGHTGGGPGCTPTAYHFPGPTPLTIAVFTDGEDGDQAEWMVMEAADALRSPR
ncbi:serine hydrolase domain-containing protein [Azospirillum rugosum]|uniref:CubicO group peptidase (Beta-lactamase class C family) n=1 Tax=Azospirillum rugosum TaxID=416170 RepID=A0ABS4SRV9_9PROT|nr:serine hydrolase domain-containing protein [Azospirillum rugosum]MBP2295288.1 CubicO group peptidase (beta-lactamase class C family) [Azospirillum rugosum]MDQ0528663.1 CubicO group peptidase (beta-lactamase class C family) [Azospirillum rugosum]